MTSKLLEKFNQDGFLVLEDFYTPAEINELLKAGRALPSQAPKEERCAFQSQQRDKKYFLESGNKICYFFEATALGPNNELIVPEEFSLNKVGHALGVQHPVFRKYTFDNRIRELCWQLGFQKPALTQSMYMFKNPGIGAEVTAHQDATYMYTEPLSVVGFWIALDDATFENGCLKFIRGSHKNGVHRRYMRNNDPNSEDVLVFDKPAPIYQQSSFTAVPVKSGTLVVIHGNVVHRSDPNRSQKSRHAYTFHVIETKDTKYSPDNWLQPNEPFPILYERSNTVINRLIEMGKRVYFITNNSTRTREELAEKAKIMDFNVGLDNMISTSYLAAHYLKSQNFNKKVYIVGSSGISRELDAVGIKHTGVGPDFHTGSLMAYMNENLVLDPEIGAVIVGFDEHISFQTKKNVIPGTGSIVKAVETCAERKTIVMGKPENWLCDIFFKDDIKNNSNRFLMIGDRLNTDVLFGKKNNLQTLLVESGVHKIDKVKQIIEYLEKNTELERREDLVNQIPDYFVTKLGDLLNNFE
ncbi:hypothetical protein PVAND_014393 [Polypedilum vanderplanki]|uniref:Uncharacterized protein n=1 Tax=Polypedilum vanderplanki TaxID=319348 RepID=A0A9J6B9H0_POLVA|nr:hypothetical protein PVAND_014393 [Polypedilum vanderplanki]